MKLDARLLRQARAAAGLLTLAVGLGLAGGLFAIGQAQILSRVINGLHLGGWDSAQAWAALKLMAVVIVGRGLATYGGEWAAAAAALRIKRNLRQMLAEKILGGGPLGLDREESGELAAAAVEGVEAVEAYFSQYLPQIALAALIPTAILVVVFPLDALSGLVLLLTAPLIPIFMVLIGGASAAVTRKQWSTLARLSAFFLDTLQGLTTLKLLNQSLRQAERIEGASQRYSKATLEVLRVTFLSALVLELVSTLSTAVVAVQIGLRLLYGLMGFEQAFFILVIAPEFYLPLRNLGLRFHAAMNGAAAAQRIFGILEKPETCEPQLNAGGEEAPLAAAPRIEFRGVSARYAGRAEAALREVNLTLPAGKVTALTGHSGAGKSTLARLLLRFAAAEAGEIWVDGRPLGSLTLGTWRCSVSWVPQHPALFAGTLAENIRLGNPQAAEDAVRRAAQQAGMDEFLARLPLGLETRIGEGGARLSGGQAQRVALARAFLMDAPVVILDEPGAHLDPELEETLTAATRRLLQGRTVLVIAHRLATVLGADQVVWMEAGRAAECGSPHALMQSGGAFAAWAGSLGGQA